MRAIKTNYINAKWISWVFCLICVGISCGANQGVLTSGKGTPGPTAEAKADTFESDLAEVRKADFTWMYVIRRLDGGVLDTKDKDLIRVATAQSNRRVLSDEGKVIIVGSNFEQVNASLIAHGTIFPSSSFSTPSTRTCTVLTPIISTQRIRNSTNCSRTSPRARSTIRHR